ncbi:MAG: pyridoxal phosphate-dependent aminotransferase [Phycisphaerales bacterium]|nr:pyridoxal phosphate-dependent aminotransferase [Phycisphaerales bacterium]
MAVVSSSVRLSDRARTLKPSATFAVTARVKTLVAEGKDVIGFGAGEPDFDTPEPIKEAAIAALRDGMTGYQPVPGRPEARAAIARKLQRENGIECGPDDIVISVGAKHSLYLALQAIVNPGQEVIVATPGWVSYMAMVGLCGGTTIEVPGATENDFKLTPAQLEAAITPQTRAFIINSPSNPCGTMYTPDELAELGDVLATHPQVAIISDEIYEKLIYADVAHFSLGSLPALRERVITINGLSKAYAMTGWRLGYACAPGDDGVVAKAMARLQGQMTSHATSFAFPAIVDAIERRGDEVERMRRTFGERATLIHARLSAIPGVVCPRPTGAFYVFPDVSAFYGGRTPAGRVIDTSVAFAEALLEEAHVAVVPGEAFGACGGTHVRLSFACGTEQIEEGCRRITQWLATIERPQA